MATFLRLDAVVGILDSMGNVATFWQFRIENYQYLVLLQTKFLVLFVQHITIIVIK